jgi:hypothetical protein
MMRGAVVFMNIHAVDYLLTKALRKEKKIGEITQKKNVEAPQSQ